MTQQKPKALTFEEFIKSATMFYFDSDLEKEFENLADADIKELQSIPPSIATMDGIRKYVRDNKKALHNLTSLLNISEERFKRIITMSRIQKKHIPTSDISFSVFCISLRWFLFSFFSQKSLCVFGIRNTDSPHAYARNTH